MEKKESYGIGDGSSLDRFGMESEIAAVKKARIEGYWEFILVDDRLFYRDSYCTHANVQPKAVFSYDMTAMDKISGWEDEERWVESKFATCMRIYTSKGVDRRARSHSRNGEILEGTLDDHCVMHELSMRRYFRQPRVGIRKYNNRKRRSDGSSFGLRDLYSVCGTVVYDMVLATPRLNQTLEMDRKTQKYHEAVDKAIAEAISKPVGRTHTPRTCMLASVASVFYKTHMMW